MREPDLLFAPPRVVVEREADGSMTLRSPDPLGDPGRVVGDWLERWAVEAPDRPFLLERGADRRWVGPTYAEAYEAVWRIAGGLLARGLGPDRPVAILSDNSVEHALLSLAAMHVGIPVAPVSPAYSVMSSDYKKLRRIILLTGPGLIYVADHVRYGPALSAIPTAHDAEVVSGTAREPLNGVTPFAAVTEGGNRAEVFERFRSIGPDTVAKLLFTSGSTGEPKAVINTQRMLCANQQQRAQVWPFVERHPPVVLDWLPWSHTFGGNHNFNMVLRQGGTLYLDGGRPAPPLFPETIANLREVSPTIYFNVPRGYDMLVAALREDEELRRSFFARLQVVFYAAAALPPHLWDALRELARETVGEPVVVTSAWGSTETAPLAADCHFQAERSGVIGLPVPGAELRLVPEGDKLEVRVRGPNVTPGYWRRDDLTATHFDERGFYRIGDAVRFVDPSQPARGLLFDGRVAEDFKLDSGTWVNVGMLRVQAIAALAPVAQDLAVAGHDRSEVGFLVFPNLAACRALAGMDEDEPADAVLAHQAVRQAVAAGLGKLKREATGSSMHGGRAILLADPPSIDRGEITDKAYLNQRAVLQARSELVAALFDDSDQRVIRPAP
ncbi:MAG: feruloyl-CoA synthase [Gemmatimonadales bacterium]